MLARQVVLNRVLCRYVGQRTAVSWKSKLQSQTRTKSFDGHVYDISVDTSRPTFYFYKKLVINESERYAIYQRNGKLDLVDGPTRKVLFSQQAVKLRKAIASSEQILVVKNNDGTTEHISGPTSLWVHPTKHQSVHVLDKFEILTGELLVVYTNPSETAKAVQRAVIRGPCHFQREPNQWIHKFSWEDEDGKFEFMKLQTSNSIEICLEGLKTKCHATLSSVKLSVAFKILDVEKMLENSQNPVTDFTSAVSADLLHFVGNLSITEFKEKSDSLNTLENFPITQQRARDIGFSLERSDLCGYQVADSIQQLLDKEIHASISQRIQQRSDEQLQKSLDFKLEQEGKRQMKELELQEKKFESELQQLVRKEESLSRIRVEERKKLLHEKVEQMKQLKSMGIDATRVLVSENQGNFTKHLFSQPSSK